MRVRKTKEGYRLSPSFQQVVLTPLEEWAKAHGLKTRDYLILSAIKSTCFRNDESDLLRAWQLYEVGRSPKRSKVEGFTIERLASGLKASRTALAEWLAGEEKALNAVIGMIVKEASDD